MVSTSPTPPPHPGRAAHTARIKSASIHIQLFSTGLPLQIRIHSLAIGRRRHGERVQSVTRERNGMARHGTARHDCNILYICMEWICERAGGARPGRGAHIIGGGGGRWVLGALDACPLLPRAVTTPPRQATAAKRNRHVSISGPYPFVISGFGRRGPLTGRQPRYTGVNRLPTHQLAGGPTSPLTPHGHGHVTALNLCQAH